MLRARRRYLTFVILFRFIYYDRFEKTYQVKKLIFLSVIISSQTLKAQNVGIGTSTPLQKLHVEGTTYLNGNVGIGNATPTFPLSFAPALGDKISLWSNSTNSYGFGIQGSLLQIHTDISAADIVFGYGSSEALTERMRIKGNGNVGIGTINPDYPLDVTGNSSTTGRFVNTATFLNNYGLAGSCYNTPGYGLGISGFGGLGGVQGIADLSGTGSRYGLFGQGANGIAVNYGVYGEATSGALAYGIFGSASGAATNWAGYFTGSVYATVYSTSDRKLKNAIKPLSAALSIINQLNPSVYTFRTNEYQQMHLPEGLHYGLIADEVLQVMPGAVKKAVQPAQYENHNEHSGKKLSDEVEFNAVNYTEMIPVLIGAVKEQQIIINNQQKQIDELRTLVKKLLKQ